MLTLVAERTLDELSLVRSVLSGEMPAGSLPPVLGSTSEADHRGKVALAMVLQLGGMLRRVLSVSAESDGMMYAIAGGPRIVPLPPPEEEKGPFGFAQYRTAA